MNNQSRIVAWILELVGDLMSTECDEKRLLALEIVDNDLTLESSIAQAARLGHTDIVKTLVQHGANAREPPAGGGKSLLTTAIDGTCIPEVVDVLVKSGEEASFTLDTWNSLFSKLPDPY
ncbi:hypothetical protein BJX65DRAFT_301864 [Aspergillus insuetus]